MSETNVPAVRDSAAIVERVVIQGDLAKLTPVERVDYYRSVCDSLGVNPLTKPFEYITLNGKLTLYALRGCADQLRKLHGVSVEIRSREIVNDLCIVTAHAVDSTGRSDEEIGAVSVAGLRGEPLANALLKATTKAKRRVTLSLCGLGWLDETEIESIPTARPVVVTEDGEIVNDREAETRRVMSASQFAKPKTRTEPREELDDTPDRAVTLRKLHSCGLSHDEVHELAIWYADAKLKRTVESMRDLSDSELDVFQQSLPKHTPDYWRGQLAKRNGDRPVTVIERVEPDGALLIEVVDGDEEAD